MTPRRTRAALLGAAMLGAGAVATAPARAALVTYEYTGAIQTFEVTVSGDYRISAFGAQGGGSTQNDNTGGLGAQAEGTVSLAAGDVLTIVVGGAGETSRNSGGGGGGSYVFFADPLMALVIAGGGGGAGFNVDGSAGHSGPDGTAGGTPGSGGVGGTDGQGGGGVVTAAVNFGAGGGGFLTAGSDGGQTDEEFPAVSGGGQAGSGSALGGAGIGYFGSLNVAGDGGFGGGGGGGNGGGGGGGGYSGGGGGGGQGGQGGGGGSFVTLDADDVLLLAGVREGHGLVTIEFLPPTETAVPEPGSLALLGLGLAGLAALRRRR